MTDFYQPESFLFAPRPRHADIKKSYRGTSPTWFDGWVYPTLDDLYMAFDVPHLDWERDQFMKEGWLR